MFDYGSVSGPAPLSPRSNIEGANKASPSSEGAVVAVEKKTPDGFPILSEADQVLWLLYELKICEDVYGTPADRFSGIDSFNLWSDDPESREFVASVEQSLTDAPEFLSGRGPTPFQPLKYLKVRKNQENTSFQNAYLIGSSVFEKLQTVFCRIYQKFYPEIPAEKILQLLSSEWGRNRCVEPEDIDFRIISQDDGMNQRIEIDKLITYLSDITGESRAQIYQQWIDRKLSVIESCDNHFGVMRIDFGIDPATNKKRLPIEIIHVGRSNKGKLTIKNTFIDTSGGWVIDVTPRLTVADGEPYPIRIGCGTLDDVSDNKKALFMRALNGLLADAPKISDSTIDYWLWMMAEGIRVTEIGLETQMVQNVFDPAPSERHLGLYTSLKPRYITLLLLKGQKLYKQHHSKDFIPFVFRSCLSLMVNAKKAEEIQDENPGRQRAIERSSNKDWELKDKEYTEIWTGLNAYRLLDLNQNIYPFHAALTSALVEHKTPFRVVVSVLVLSSWVHLQHDHFSHHCRKPVFRIHNPFKINLPTDVLAAIRTIVDYVEKEGNTNPLMDLYHTFISDDTKAPSPAVLEDYLHLLEMDKKEFFISIEKLNKHSDPFISFLGFQLGLLHRTVQGVPRYETLYKLSNCASSFPYLQTGLKFLRQNSTSEEEQKVLDGLIDHFSESKTIRKTDYIRMMTNGGHPDFIARARKIVSTIDLSALVDENESREVIQAHLRVCNAIYKTNPARSIGVFNRLVWQKLVSLDEQLNFFKTSSEWIHSSKIEGECSELIELGKSVLDGLKTVPIETEDQLEVLLSNIRLIISSPNTQAERNRLLYKVCTNEFSVSRELVESWTECLEKLWIERLTAATESSVQSDIAEAIVQYKKMIEVGVLSADRLNGEEWQRLRISMGRHALKLQAVIESNSILRGLLSESICPNVRPQFDEYMDEILTHLMKKQLPQDCMEGIDELMRAAAPNGFDILHLFCKRVLSTGKPGDLFLQEFEQFLLKERKDDFFKDHPELVGTLISYLEAIEPSVIEGRLPNVWRLYELVLRKRSVNDEGHNLLRLYRLFARLARHDKTPSASRTVFKSEQSAMQTLLHGNQCYHELRAVMTFFDTSAPVAQANEQTVYQWSICQNMLKTDSEENTAEVLKWIQNETSYDATAFISTSDGESVRLLTRLLIKNYLTHRSPQTRRWLSFCIKRLMLSSKYNEVFPLYLSLVSTLFKESNNDYLTLLQAIPMVPDDFKNQTRRLWLEIAEDQFPEHNRSIIQYLLVDQLSLNLFEGHREELKPLAIHEAGRLELSTASLETLQYYFDLIDTYSIEQEVKWLDYFTALSEIGTSNTLSRGSWDKYLKSADPIQSAENRAALWSRGLTCLRAVQDPILEEYFNALNSSDERHPFVEVLGNEAFRKFKWKALEDVFIGSLNIKRDRSSQSLLLSEMRQLRSSLLNKEVLGGSSRNRSTVLSPSEANFFDELIRLIQNSETDVLTISTPQGNLPREVALWGIEIDLALVEHFERAVMDDFNRIQEIDQILDFPLRTFGDRSNQLKIDGRVVLGLVNQIERYLAISRATSSECDESTVAKHSKLDELMMKTIGTFRNSNSLPLICYQGLMKLSENPAYYEFCQDQLFSRKEEGKNGDLIPVKPLFMKMLTPPRLDYDKGMMEQSYVSLGEVFQNAQKLENQRKILVIQGAQLDLKRRQLGLSEKEYSQLNFEITLRLFEVQYLFLDSLGIIGDDPFYENSKAELENLIKARFQSNPRSMIDFIIFLKSRIKKSEEPWLQADIVRKQLAELMIHFVENHEVFKLNKDEIKKMIANYVYLYVPARANKAGISKTDSQPHGKKMPEDITAFRVLKCAEKKGVFKGSAHLLFKYIHYIAIPDFYRQEPFQSRISDEMESKMLIEVINELLACECPYNSRRAIYKLNILHKMIGPKTIISILPTHQKIAESSVRLTGPWEENAVTLLQSLHDISAGIPSCYSGSSLVVFQNMKRAHFDACLQIISDKDFKAREGSLQSHYTCMALKIMDSLISCGYYKKDYSVLQDDLRKLMPTMIRVELEQEFTVVEGSCLHVALPSQLCANFVKLNFQTPYPYKKGEMKRINALQVKLFREFINELIRRDSEAFKAKISLCLIECFFKAECSKSTQEIYRSIESRLGDEQGFSKIESKVLEFIYKRDKFRGDYPSYSAYFVETCQLLLEGDYLENDRLFIKNHFFQLSTMFQEDINSCMKENGFVAKELLLGLFERAFDKGYLKDSSKDKAFEKACAWMKDLDYIARLALLLNAASPRPDDEELQSIKVFAVAIMPRLAMEVLTTGNLNHSTRLLKMADNSFQGQDKLDVMKHWNQELRGLLKEFPDSEAIKAHYRMSLEKTVALALK